MNFKRNFSRIILLLSIFAWAMVLLSIIKAPDSSAAELPPAQETERLPGDDIPATEKCYMDAEEIQEDYENEQIEEALLANAHVIEDCLVTHYDCCVKCCGKSDGITASGLRATPYVTVGVDPNIIPLGSDVLVDYGDGEIQYYRADDTGVKGNHIDVCVSSHAEALELGVCRATVYWVDGHERTQ